MQTIMTQSQTQDMETPFFKAIGDVTRETLQYIKDRKDKKIVSLKSRWKKFNRATGGIEPNMIFTIAGISGAGKSAFANSLAFDLIELNPTEEVVILNFSFEMVDYRNVGRTISSKVRKSVSELYSANETLNDEDFSKVQSAAKSLAGYPMYFIDSACTVEQIGNTIDFFHENIAKGKWLIVILDHALLVNGDGGERSIIVDLQKMFIRKKKLSKTTIIQLSQMNRNIETPERINNPSVHFPMRSDLSASDAIFQASDFVLAIHRPELLQLPIYGVQRLPVKNKVYIHFLKVRDGEPCILEFENELKYGNLVESTEVEKKETN